MKMKMKRAFGWSGRLQWFALTVGVLMLIPSLLWAQTVKIGMVFPLSGGIAESASWGIEGTKMAVEEINDKGGIPIQGKNYKVELVLYDSKGDPTTGVAAVEKLINRDQVVAIAGDYCSSAVLAEREVSGRNKIVHVTGYSIHPKITAPGYPYMFRICSTIDMYAAPFVDFVAKKLPAVKRVGIIAVTDDYGRGEVEIYTNLYQKNGINVVAAEYFKHGDKDFYTQLTKIKAANPDAIYIVTDEDSQNIGVLKQVRELGFKGHIFGCSTYVTGNILKLGGKELLEGMYTEGVDFEFYKDKPAVKEFRNRYFAKYKREANGFSTPGYRHIMLIADALKRANTLTDMEKIRDAMASTNLSSVLLGYSGSNFNSVNQIVPALGVLQYKDGKVIVVYDESKEK